jgi:two-component system C4-dicarboxylate transport sensor histidine kinase DctB
VNEFGGWLTAHNALEGGVVFEVQLPIYKEDVEAAE